ncbi:hypothetical protein Tco_1357684, partial [Tanacetum coccineum]
MYPSACALSDQAHHTTYADMSPQYSIVDQRSNDAILELSKSMPHEALAYRPSYLGAVSSGSLSAGVDIDTWSLFVCLAGITLLTRSQQRGIISPFNAMHSGCTLLDRPLEILYLPFGVMHSGCTLLARPLEILYSPFGAMHAGSSLLTDGQQR